MSLLEQRYVAVLQEIANAAKQHKRDVDDIELIVISKNHDAQLVRDLHALGQKAFGENRDQEARPKAEQTQDLEGINWHFVGQLQSNKAKSVLGYASYLHSIDRPSLVQALRRDLATAEKRLGGFIQLNLTDDPNRGGIQPDRVIEFAEGLLDLPHFDLLGVMGVAALNRDPRIDFETIAKASQQLQTVSPEAKFISAGMSHDFAEAIEFGATHLRIGTAITGNRNL